MADTLSARLAKFMRLLSSDKDGEVIAAAGAIRRVLLAADLDIHDLADVIERSNIGNTAPARPQPRPRYSYRPAPPDSGFAEWARHAGAGTRWTHDFKEWPEEEEPADSINHARAEYCWQFRNTILNSREVKFVEDMLAQSLARRLTFRQSEWLEAIWRKCQPFDFGDVG